MSKVSLKKSELNNDKLLSLLEDLKEILIDNGQNIKDCYKLIKALETELCPKKKTFFQKLKCIFINIFKI